MAEEVPRWIGLSLASLFFLGLGSVTYFGIELAQRRYEVGIDAAHEQSVDFLAMLVGSVADDPARLREVLGEFAQVHDCRRVRVTDGGGVVVASILGDEVGQTRPRLAQDDQSGDGRSVSRTQQGSEEGGSFRAAVPSKSSVHRILFVEGVFGEPPSASAPGLGGRIGEKGAPELGMALGLAVVTVSIGFLVTYRLLRRHFRSLAQISENLVSRGDRIAQDIEVMRVADERSAVAIQWNRLIDFVDELSERVQKTNASAELKDVLERTRRGELSSVVDVLPDGLLYIVDRGRLAYANTTARRLLGISDEGADGVGESSHERDRDLRSDLGSMNLSATGRMITACVMGALSEEPGSAGFRTVSEVLEAGGGSGEGRREPEAGTSASEESREYYLVRVLPLLAARGGGRRTGHQVTGACAVVITDISQRIRADRAREEFVSQVTHDLRTPLTNIRAYAETLSSGVFDDPAVITECYNVITKETRRLSRLIEDILSISQLEVGSIQLRVANVDLRALLTEAVRDLRGLADERGIDMQLALPSKLPALEGDRDKLAVIINNLLGNALKYTPSGGSVRVGCQSAADEVLISVKDTGMGIDQKDHERVFEKFCRGSSPGVNEIEGTGIGLTTAREIARRHRGEIKLMSAPGEGATFVVHLPLKQSNRVGAGMFGAVRPEPAEPAGTRPTGDGPAERVASGGSKDPISTSSTGQAKQSETPGGSGAASGSSVRSDEHGARAGAAPREE